MRVYTHTHAHARTHTHTCIYDTVFADARRVRPCLERSVLALECHREGQLAFLLTLQERARERQRAGERERESDREQERESEREGVCARERERVLWNIIVKASSPFSSCCKGERGSEGARERLRDRA